MPQAVAAVLQLRPAIPAQEPRDVTCARWPPGRARNSGPETITTTSAVTVARPKAKDAQPTPPAQPRRVFVAYDFRSSPAPLRLLLENTKSTSSAGPGTPPLEFVLPEFEGLRAGDLRDRLEDDLRSVEVAVAFLDVPNANVGFELGLVYSKGIAIVLASLGKDRPAVLDADPLHGQRYQRIRTAEMLRSVARLPLEKMWFFWKLCG